MRSIEAAEWLVRLQDPDVDTDELLEWESWLYESKLNRRAFDDAVRQDRRIQAMKGDLDDIPMPTRDELAADDYDGRDPVTPWTMPKVTGTSKHGPAARVSPLQRRSFAIAAGMAVLAVAAGILIRGGLMDSNSPEQIASFQTSSSEHQNVVLSDGSEVSIGAMSNLSVDFTRDRRTVVLGEGEALFTIAKDPRRPFVVVAGSGAITAVGTEFNVRRDGGRVVVTVIEGIVEFDRTRRHTSGSLYASHEAEPEPTQLTIGQQVVYDSTGVNVAQVQDPIAVTAWQSGHMQYRSEPLKYVISGVNRYSEKEIIIADLSVETMVFTGSVFPEQIEGWLAGLENVFPIEVVETGSDKVLLKKREQP